MSEPARLVTADELARIPDDDYRYELVAGRIIRMSPTGGVHGCLVLRLGSFLREHVEAYNLGRVMTETGFKLASNPDTVRGPDLSFVRRERIPSSGLPRGFWNGPPDLAVEILSPDDRPSETLAKVDEYLTLGVRLVWVVEPDEESATAYRRWAVPVTIGIDEELDGGDVVPGFRCPLRRVFGSQV